MDNAGGYRTHDDIRSYTKTLVDYYNIEIILLTIHDLGVWMSLHAAVETLFEVV